MRTNTNLKILTQSELIEKKKPDKIVVIKEQMDRDKKKFPAKFLKEHVHMQYVTDTFSFESIFFILRDIMMNPLYPNALAL
jgi:hypothetical protein